MLKGIICWFSNEFGYGFIQDNDGVDVFVHYSVVKAEGYKTLFEGQEVEYESADGPKGRHAVNVVPKKAE